jgi:predicted dinucleotide-binding enzyme
MRAVMATKKKKKTDLVLIGTLVPVPHSDALKLLARNQERSVSKIVKKLLEDSPHFQEALKQIQAA